MGKNNGIAEITSQLPSMVGSIIAVPIIIYVGFPRPKNKGWAIIKNESELYIAINIFPVANNTMNTQIRAGDSHLSMNLGIINPEIIAKIE